MTKIADKNNVVRDMTAEEEAIHAELTQDAIALREAEEAEATALANLKDSAKAKLIAGEPLTEDEANTIVL